MRNQLFNQMSNENMSSELLRIWGKKTPCWRQPRSSASKSPPRAHSKTPTPCSVPKACGSQEMAPCTLKHRAIGISLEKRKSSVAPSPGQVLSVLLKLGTVHSYQLGQHSRKHSTSSPSTSSPKSHPLGRVRMGLGFSLYSSSPSPAGFRLSDCASED